MSHSKSSLPEYLLIGLHLRYSGWVSLITIISQYGFGLVGLRIWLVVRTSRPDGLTTSRSFRPTLLVAGFRSSHSFPDLFRSVRSLPLCPSAPLSRMLPCSLRITEMQTQVADATNRWRVPQEQVVQVMVEEVEDEDEHDLADKQTYLMPELQAIIKEVKDKNLPSQLFHNSARLSHMPAAFAAAARVLPPNATIIANLLETYLREYPGDSNAADSKIVVVAESRALCAILLVIDSQDKVEAILDPGC